MYSPKFVQKKMFQNKTTRIILGLLGLVLLVYLLWNVRTIIYYFFASAIIAFIARPLVRLLGKITVKGRVLPEWLKSTVVLLLLFSLLIGAFSYIIPTVLHQANLISKIDTDTIIKQLQPQIKSGNKWLQKVNIDPGQLTEIIQSEVTNIFKIGDIRGYISNFIGGLSDALIGLFSIVFISFFLLKDGRIVDNVVDSLTPDMYLDKIKTIFNEAKDLLSRYFVGVVIQISIVMFVITVGLTIVGVKNALLIGLIAGVFNIIPYLGPLLGGLVGLSLAMTTQLEVNPFADVTGFLLVAIVPFVVAQLLDNFILQPFIFSKSVKAHPLEIFLVILAAGSLGGAVGMIVAVPVYSFIRIVAKEFFNGYKVVQGLTKDL